METVNRERWTVNRKVMAILALTCLFTVHGSQITFAASVRSGAAFLQLDTAARPAAMGSAYTAGSGDIDTVAYNPGGLAALERQQAAFTHAEWLVGTQYDYLAYGQPTRWGTFSLSATRLGYGDLEGRDAARQPTGTFSADDSAYALSYARSLGEEIGVGTTLKILQRKIDSERASSYAMDFGGVGRIPGKPVSVGASILNVGPGMRFIDQTDPLPLTFALGAAYEPSRPLKWMLDFKHEPNDHLTTAMAGMEYSPMTWVALRGGYRMPLSSTGDESAWDVNNLRGGMGLRIASWRLDYALAPFGDLGITHRFTLAVSFGAKQESLDSKILKSAQVPFQKSDQQLLRMMEAPQVAANSLSDLPDAVEFIQKKP